jgi:hypothetical protein
LATHGDGLGLFIGFWAKTFDLHHRHLLLGEDFNVAHETLLIQGHQADRFTA